MKSSAYIYAKSAFNQREIVYENKKILSSSFV